MHPPLRKLQQHRRLPSLVPVRALHVRRSPKTAGGDSEMEEKGAGGGRWWREDREMRREMYHELEKLEDPNQKYLSLFISACLCLYDVPSRQNI